MLNAMQSDASEKSTFCGKILARCLITCIISAGAFAQDITNTLGTNGVFSIKDAATTFLSLRQSDGYIGIGTLTPQSKFDVNGNAQIRGNLSLSATNPNIVI